MNLHKAGKQLQTQGQAIIALCGATSEEDARWKPDPENWSILEVLNHLVDEETLDFRTHLAHILNTPDQPWPQIDPARWVTEKRYNEQRMDETLEKFTVEREKSVTWLDSLTAPDWHACVSLPWGALSAGDMLAAWLAHDLLHLRQLNTLRFQRTQMTSHPFRVDYAGKW